MWKKKGVTTPEESILGGDDFWGRKVFKDAIAEL